MSKDIYNSFDEMLRDKSVLSMLPQLEPIAHQVSAEQLISAGMEIYRKFPGSNRVTQNGAIPIGVKFIRKTYE